MADILEMVLRGEITVTTVLQWLQNKDEVLDLPQQLKDARRLRCEFVPYFLNYLRDQTLPLLQNSKSVTPSPVKTPSTQKVKLDRICTPEGRNPGSANRVQLFSPVERPDVSPSCSLDVLQDSSPKIPVTPTERNQRTHYDYIPRNKQHKHSPRDSRYHQKPTIDPHKSKHKISLGDFLTSPDVPSSNRKKKSPLVTVKRDRYREDGQSPSPGTSRRWNGKKRQTTPEHQAGRGKERCGDEGRAKVFNLSNSEDFPSIRESSQPVATTPVAPVRRINPTPVRADMKRPQNAAFLETSSVWGTPSGGSLQGGSGFNQVDSRGEAPLVLDMERALLRREKAKMQERTSGSGETCLPALTCVTPTKQVLQRENSVREPAVALRSEVTHEDTILLLADLYTGCIDENLLPNLNVELYFLVQLLTIQEVIPSEDQQSRDPEDLNYFTSIHNAVFFSVLTLEKQISLLSMLDRSTMRLLSDNPRVVEFSPKLASQLNTLQESAQTKTGPVFPRSPIGGVSFQADTDNRENFPSHQSFLQFKKQRDQFYELIREWEDSHMTPGWQMVERLGIRIKSLVQSRTELANHIHLARLFQSQLLAMCKGDQNYKTEGDDEQIALLSQLKKSNPEKFKRLQERFVTPLTTAGPCPPQSFPGCQEFFRDFILAAGCHSFNQHLTDIFSAKLIELDSAELSETDVETEEGRTHSVIDEEDKEQFVSSLLAARLVGKFMGFVTFLPYQTLERLPDSLLPSYLEIRAKGCLPLNVVEHVERACITGRLVMTLPWVVEFLSMMDPLSPLLLHFQTLIARLLQIYRQAVQKFQRGEAKYNNLLLIFTLGWFFELPVLPEGIFFQGISENQSCYPQTSKDTKQLDSMDLIDQQVLYTCCPYLVEVRSLLLEFAVGRSNRSSTIRKITPVAADDTPAPTATEKQLQLQMEENFFHNHPASLKRVVEFVAERVASNYIKKLRSSTLTQALSSAKECVGKLVSSLSGVSPNSRIREKLSQDVLKEAGLLFEKVRSEVAHSQHSYCHGKILEILPLLLPEEQVSAVVSVAVSISSRQAEERVNQWVGNHITTRIFQRQMSEELEKLCRPVNLQKMIQTLPEWKDTTGGAEEAVAMGTGVHDENSLGPTDSLTETKVFVRDVIIYGKVPTAEEISSCVQRVANTLTSRQDLLPEVYRTFSQMLQDLALYLLCCEPQLWSFSLCSRCLSLWTGELREYVQFTSLFSPRLLHWSTKSSNPQVSWRELTAFVVRLQERDVVKSAQIHKSALAVLHLSAELGVFEELGSLLMTVLRSLDRDHDRNFKEVEEWSEVIDTLHALSQDHCALRKQLKEWSGSVGVAPGGMAPVKLTGQDDDRGLTTMQSVIRTNSDILQSPCAGSRCECSDPIHVSVTVKMQSNMVSTSEKVLPKTDPVTENNQLQSIHPTAHLAGRTPVDSDTTMVRGLSGLSSYSLQSVTVTPQTIQSSAKT